MLTDKEGVKLEITIQTIKGYFAYFLPRAFSYSIIIGLVCATYLSATAWDWSLNYFGLAFIVWLILWTFALMFILPMLRKEKWPFNMKKIDQQPTQDQNTTYTQKRWKPQRDLSTLVAWLTSLRFVWSYSIAYEIGGKTF